jgi:predicted alpha/beta superfamily hydrolase
MLNSLQVKDLGRTPVPFSRRFNVRSDRVGENFAIDVALPPHFLPGSPPWPILFVTDGDIAFPTTASTAGVLPIEPGGPVPLCVVGIGYGSADEGENGVHFALRNRDLTPVRNEDWEMRMRAAPPPFCFGDELQTGGGERFLDFILEELTPWLADNFPVDASDPTLAGSSFGATLVLHAMFTRPGAFARHLAISPSLWWADRHLVRLEQRFADTHSDLDTRLYLCVGEAEEAQAPAVRMVSEFSDFAERLKGRSYPSLRVAHDILPGETHVSVFNAGISNGIRHLFDATFLTL